MLGSNVTSVILFFLSSLVHGVHNLDYSDLEALGVNCPRRDKCEGYRNNLTYTERSCECDFACNTYNDCCIDALRRRSSARTAARSGMRCMHYGLSEYTGVYVIANCSSTWNGSTQIRQKCVGPTNFQDPLVAAPVVSVPEGIAYRNRFCAECNDARITNLQTFQFKLACGGLLALLTEQQIFANLTYNRKLGSWGVNRLNSFGNETNFVGCDIHFDVPDYLNRSVRFCRSNIISTCSSNWTRQAVRRACEEYMAVVYDSNHAYRNPHCAICNHRTVGQVSCSNDLLSRKRPMSFALLLDVNQSDGDQVGMRRVATPECPSGHKYDPFFKRCRQLVCAIPGYVVVDGRCVRS